MAKNRFLRYMALGGVWYGAKYSHGVWERFAHRFESFKNRKKTNLIRALFEVSSLPCRGDPFSEI